MTNSLRKTTFRKTILSCAITAALTPLPMSSALAQDTSVLDEVVVIGTKRAVNVQDIPIAITAIDGAVLSDLSIHTAVDLVKVAPGLKIQWQGRRPDFNMRGGGVAGLNGPAVPLYTNGLAANYGTPRLYRSTGAAWSGWLDLERVEVMRGPQGTLYGANTLGGLVNIIYKRPSTEAVDYGFAATVGDYDARKLEGFVNLPLGDTFAMRLTANKTDQDPLIENKDNPAGSFRDADDSYVRAQLYWAPTDAFDVNVEYTRWDNDSMGNANYGHHYVGLPINSETGRSSGFGDDLHSRKAPIDGDVQTGGRTYHNASPDTNPTGYREANGNFDSIWEADTETFGIELNWDLGFADLSVKARNTEGYFVTAWDVDAGPANLLDGNVASFANDQLDIVLNSKGDQSFRWTLGYNTADAWDFDDNNGSYLWGYPDGALDDNTGFPNWTYWDSYGAKSNAIYGNAEYDISDAVTISAGVRYQEDSTRFARFDTDASTTGIIWPGYIQPVTGLLDASFYTVLDQNAQVDDADHTDYRVALSYAVNDDMNFYGSYSTGYIPRSISVGNILEPNELDAIELGYKSMWADNTVRFNAALYQSEYTNLAFKVFFTCGASICTSEETGGGLTSQGVEFELQWQPVDALTIIAGLVFDDTTFDDFFVNESVFTEARWVEDAASPDGGYWPYRPGGHSGAWLRSDTDEVVPTPSYDMSGEEASFSPDYIFNFDVSYRIELGGGGAIIPGITLYSQDTYRTMNEPYAFAAQQGYTTIDLRATWITSLENLEVKAYITNATDELYKVSQNAFSGGRIMADYGRQRVWGVRVGYGF